MDVYDEGDETKEERHVSYGFCGCCGDQVLFLMDQLIKIKETELLAKKIRSDLASDPTEACPYVEGMIGLTIRYLNKHILSNEEQLDLLFENESDELVRMCIEFLLLRGDNYKGGSLCSFVCNFFLLPGDAYPYIVMQWLQNEELISHGIAIRCAWLTKPEKYSQDKTFHYAAAIQSFIHWEMNGETS